MKKTQEITTYNVCRRNGIIVCLLVLLLLMPAIASAMSKVDSLSRVIPTLHGKDKLVALDGLIAMLDNIGDGKRQLNLMKQMLEEAKKQGNAEYVGNALYSICCYYYDRCQNDEFEKFLPEAKRHFKEQEDWETYYIVWSLKVENALYAGQTQTAINEAKAMCDEATKTNNVYGKAISQYELGSVYHNIDEPVAVRYFKDAITNFKQLSLQTSILMRGYEGYCSSLNDMKKYAELKNAVSEWGKELQKYSVHRNKDEIKGEQVYYNIYKSFDEIYSGQMQQAKADLDKTDKLIGDGPGYRAQYYLALATYYKYSGDYKAALDAFYKQEAAELATTDTLGYIKTLQRKADMLFLLKQGMEASEIYRQVIAKNDSVFGASTREQLNEFATIFHVDELKHQSELYRNRLWAVGGICVLLVIMIIIYISFTHRITKKNRALFDALQQKEKAEGQAQKQIEEAPVENLSTEQLLYRRICKLMNEERPYLDEGLNRNQLAMMLGTNAMYVANALKVCADGITVNDFINQYRLRSAAQQLLSHKDKAVALIADESGFSSRATFSRLFKEFFGMSASEYRKASLQKQEQ